MTLRYERLIASRPHSVADVRGKLAGFAEREVNPSEIPQGAVLSSGERYLRFTWLHLFSIDVIVDTHGEVLGIHADFE